FEFRVFPLFPPDVESGGESRENSRGTQVRHERDEHAAKAGDDPVQEEPCTGVREDQDDERTPRTPAETRDPLGFEPIRDLHGSLSEEFERACLGWLPIRGRHLALQSTTESGAPGAIASEPRTEPTPQDQGKAHAQGERGPERRGDGQIPYPVSRLNPLSAT